MRRYAVVFSGYWTSANKASKRIRTSCNFIFQIYRTLLFLVLRNEWIEKLFDSNWRQGWRFADQFRRREKKPWPEWGCCTERNDLQCAMHAHSRVTVHFEPDVEFSAGFDPGDIKVQQWRQKSHQLHFCNPLRLLKYNKPACLLALLWLDHTFPNYALN